MLRFDVESCSTVTAGLLIVAIFFPPLAVAFAAGLSPQIGVSLALLMFGWIFALPHAIWVVCRCRQKAKDSRVEKVYDALEERRTRGARAPPERLPRQPVKVELRPPVDGCGCGEKETVSFCCPDSVMSRIDGFLGRALTPYWASCRDVMWYKDPGLGG
ncbi:hypothetical protein B0T16DRAFT_220002 [Cercophora newfieldiana]|uniref:Uncharacterized protein n=1 Tax=Cercophora newfieldiana TaxID=92897 RepID=A0AA39XX66_9PEZI|nr:hypothetical protein B0T16DRAFT_220002 [Cercophora newfieldiana]